MIGEGFSTMPSRLAGELEDRKAKAAKLLPYHVPFLDECLRGILPHDLVLLGAPSGVGKTELALNVAAGNAMSGRAVAYFALEAEERELERRTKYALLSRMVHDSKAEGRGDLNYTDWLLGRCEDVVGPFNDKADHTMLSNFGKLWTFYRGSKFDQTDLRNRIDEVHKFVELIVIDHLHYIDAADNAESESQALGETVKTIRDVSLRIGKPILLVAHLRKRDRGAKQLVATLDDFHGSSNIVKICTQAITIEHASEISTPWYLAPTYMSVLKDRRGGAPRLVAVANFNKLTKNYANKYTLGKVKGTTWEELPMTDRPSWARMHFPLEGAS